MAKIMLVTTARAMMKAARATVAGAMRTKATIVTTATIVMTATVTATAATMMPNSNKHNNQILSQHQQRGTWW